MLILSYILTKYWLTNSTMASNRSLNVELWKNWCTEYIIYWIEICHKRWNLQMTLVLFPDGSPLESLVATELCERSNFFFRRRGNSQQNKNDKKNSIKKTMRQPLKIPHQTTTGKPRNCFGEPDSIGGHIRAVNVTDHWYKPSLKSFISSGPAIKFREKKFNANFENTQTFWKLSQIVQCVSWRRVCFVYLAI